MGARTVSTLIEIRNPDGCVGVCDRKCYDAKGGRCACICGGANHGVGRLAAIRNTRDLGEHWRVLVDNGTCTLQLDGDVLQQELPFE